MAANNYKKKVCVARACHVAVQRNNRTVKAAFLFIPRRSAKRFCCINPEGSDENHLGREKTLSSTLKPKDLNPAVFEIEALCATCNVLQAQDTLAACQAATA